MDRRENSLDEYFSAHTPIPSEDFAAIGDVLAAVRSNSLSRLRLAHKPRSLSFVTQSYDNSMPKLRAKHKLVEAKKQHKQLKERLSFVEGQIDSLKKGPGETTPVKQREKRTQHSYRDRSVSSNMDTGTTDQASAEGRRSSILSRVSFLHKLQREKDQRLHKLQSLESQRQQRLAADAAAAIERTEAEKQRQKQEQLEALQRRHDQEVHRKEERKRLQDESEQRLKEVHSKRFLHESWEDRFNEEVVLPELRRQQEVVARKKDPVDITGLLKHQNEVRAREEDLERKRREMRAEKKRELKLLAKELNFYRPRAADIVETEINQQKQAMVQKAEASKQYLVKKQRYDMLVRELFKPKISKLKKLEAEIRKQTTPLKKSVFSANSERPVQQRQTRPKAPPITEVRKQRKSRSTQSLSDKSPVAEPKPKDYLQDLRSKRQTSVASRIDKLYASKWQELLNDSTNPERVVEVQKEVQKMEAWARDQELLLSNMDWQQSVQAREAVSTLYVDSIKAKLALLGELV